MDGSMKKEKVKEVSPYQLFFNWLFNNNMKSPIPYSDILLKYNSPITTLFLLKMFIQIGYVNHLLNRYNHIGIFYIDKEELFYFVKECVQRFQLKRQDIHYFPHNRKSILFQKLKNKFFMLKDYEVNLLCDMVDKSEEKEIIYHSLSISKPKKIKIKKNKVTLKDFIEDNFNVLQL
jgi:hypothetical protein